MCNVYTQDPRHFITISNFTNLTFELEGNPIFEYTLAQSVLQDKAISQAVTALASIISHTSIPGDPNITRFLVLTDFGDTCQLGVEKGQKFDAPNRIEAHGQIVACDNPSSSALLYYVRKIEDPTTLSNECSTVIAGTKAQIGVKYDKERRVEYRKILRGYLPDQHHYHHLLNGEASIILKRG
jgi:hypothetical protein